MSAMAHSAGWSLAVSMAAALLVVRLRDGRRRAAISEALHELRRPLQAIALGGEGRAGEGGSMRLVARALERLEGAVDGRRLGGGPCERLRGESLLRAAVGRWRARVALEGGSLELRWWAGEVRLLGDRDALERALDNPIAHLFRPDPAQKKGPGCSRVRVLKSCSKRGSRRLAQGAATSQPGLHQGRQRIGGLNEASNARVSLPAERG